LILTDKGLTLCRTHFFIGEIEKRINNRDSRGIAAEKNETLSDIYNFRTPFYEKWADITVDCQNASISENVDKIKKNFCNTGEKSCITA